MLTPEQQAAIGGYRPQDQALLQSQLQAIADRNRDRQQLGLPIRPAPVGLTQSASMTGDLVLFFLLGLLG